MSDDSGRPIACDLGALTAAERLRHSLLARELLACAATESHAGHIVLRWPGDPATFARVAEFAGYERRCCPFIRFELGFGSESESIVLRLNGSAEALQFLSTYGLHGSAPGSGAKG